MMLCKVCGKDVPDNEAAAYDGTHEDCQAVTLKGSYRRKNDRRRSKMGNTRIPDPPLDEVEAENLFEFL